MSPPRFDILWADECRDRHLVGGKAAALGEMADAWPVPPFFWDSSGRAAIHGPLTTAQKLFGESILVDLLTAGCRCFENING